MPDTYATPLVVLVGFLGAGKTTVLKQLVVEAQSRGRSASVILNDYGDASIDVMDLQAQVQDVIPITGSCVCCSSQFDLLAALASHNHRADSAMFLETNGTTDAVTLLSMLADSPCLAGFSPPKQLSVIDAKRWGRRPHGQELEFHQMRTASHYLISHEDEVTPARFLDVLEQVKAINPYAQATTIRRFVAELDAPPKDPAHGARAQANHDTHHYSAVTIPVGSKVHREAFICFLQNLPSQVIRAKGVVDFVETPGGPRMFQVVERDVDICPYPLQKRDVASTLVMVGPSIPTDEVIERLATTFA